MTDGPIAPLPELDMLRTMGNPDLLSPPPVEVLAGARSYLGLPFAVVPGYRMLRLDLHLPNAGEPALPLVVYASGGAWRLSMRHHGPWQFLPAEGYAVAVVEYRVSGEALYPAPLHDLKSAIRFLRSRADEFGIDPARIAAWGSSAGAYLSSLAALTASDAAFEGDVGGNGEHSSAVRAVIDHYGPTDLLRIAEDTNQLPGVVEHFGTDVSPETLLLGFRPDQNVEAAWAASPVAHATKGLPFLIMHGNGETRLGHYQSVRLHEAIEAAGGQSELHILEGADHAGPEFFTDEANAVALDFLRRHL